MEDLDSTLLRPFLKDIDPIEKQNQGRLVGSSVCAIITLNPTISVEELSHYKGYQILISVKNVLA